MNYVLISVLGILAVCGFEGYKKGIIKIAMSIAAFIITIIVTFFLAPVIAQNLKDNTQLYKNLEQKIESTLLENDEINSFSLGNDNNAVSQEYGENILDATGEKYNENVLDAVNEEYDENILNNAVKNISEMLNLPDQITEKICDSSNLSQLKEYENKKIEDVKTTAIKMIAYRIASIVFNAIVNVVIFIILFIIIRMLFVITNVISRIPVIHQVNKVVGLCAGVVEGLLIVWLLFAVITACGSMEWASQALSEIADSNILSFIYDNNIILKSVFKSI